MKTHMVSALKEIVSIFSKKPVITINEEILYRYYFSMLCDALARLNAIECKSILKRIANNIIMVPNGWKARGTLKQLGYEIPGKNKDVAELIEQIKSTHKESDRCFMITELTHSLSRLPFENYKAIIANIREITEKAICQGNKELAQCFYYVAEISRDIYDSQRFLDIFAGWPTIPHEYNKIS